MGYTVDILFRYIVCIVALLAMGNNTLQAQGGDTSAAALHKTDSTLIPWEAIKDTDVLWCKRVWREIAVYETNNTELRDNPTYPAESVFANILLNGVKTGVINAYADTDLKMLVNHADLFGLAACDPVTLSVDTRIYINYFASHLNDSIEFSLEPQRRHKHKIKMSRYDTGFVKSCTYPQQIAYYDIIEDWIFDKSKGQMVVRIKAIAPVAWVANKKVPLFWLSFPYIRHYLSQYSVYTKENKPGRNWDEYFESRIFGSKITEVEQMPNSIITN